MKISNKILAVLLFSYLPCTAFASSASSIAAGAKKIITSPVGKTVGAVGGTYAVYDATKGQQAHSWKDVLQGIGGGAVTGLTIGSVVPVIGNLWGTIGGAVIGGLSAGSQLFSETDCLTDPETGQFSCCNTVFNQGERQVGIGGYMFCGAEEPNTDGSKLVSVKGKVRQCLQEGSPTKVGWWEGLFKDDTWSPACAYRYCEGETPPEAGIIEYVEWKSDKTNICWTWTCINGYTRKGNTCINNATNAEATPNKLLDYDFWINALQQEANAIRTACKDVMQLNQQTTVKIQ